MVDVLIKLGHNEFEALDFLLVLLVELCPLEVVLIREKYGPLLVCHVFEELAEIVAVLVEQKISCGYVVKQVTACLAVQIRQSFSGAWSVDHFLEHFHFNSLELRRILHYFGHVFQKRRDYVTLLLGALAENLANFGLSNVTSTCS